MIQFNEHSVYEEEGIVYFRVGLQALSINDAKLLTTALKDTIKQTSARIVVQDTRSVSDEYPPEIDRLFIALIKELPDYIDQYVAICNNPIVKLETNYVFKQVGVEDRFRAFSQDDQKEVQAFCSAVTLNW